MLSKVVGITVCLMSLPVLDGLSSAEAQDPRQLLEEMLASYDPYLIRQAEEIGLYNREEFPVVREMNPYFIRGDFNGDGGVDVAFWVEEKASGRRGVAILHSMLDTLYVYGAGRPGPPPSGGMSDRLWVDAWHVLPVGHVEEHPYGNVPAIGVVEGEPFTFERETLEFVFLGKAAYVFYWSNGQYWRFATAD